MCRYGFPFYKNFAFPTGKNVFKKFLSHLLISIFLTMNFCVVIAGAVDTPAPFLPGSYEEIPILDDSSVELGWLTCDSTSYIWALQTATGTSVQSGTINGTDPVLLVQVSGLSDGEYRWRVAGLDGSDNCQTWSSNAYDWAYFVVSTNQCPTVSNAQVTPEIGDSSTTYQYRVDYYDPEGKTPTVKNIVIDGGSSSEIIREIYFVSGSGTYSNGTYGISVSGLSEDYHNYYFQFEDGDGCSQEYRCGGSACAGPTVGKPNLTFYNLELEPETAKAGEYITIRGYVENTGLVAAEPADHRIFMNVFINDASEINLFSSKSIIMGTFATPPIEPGAGNRYSFSKEIWIPANMPSGWYIWIVAQADYADDIDELDESTTDNNCFVPGGYTVEPSPKENKLGFQKDTPYSGDPVNTAFGNFTHKETDLVIPGRGIGIEFTRFYNSMSGLDSPIGYYWNHSYNIFVHEDDGSDAVTVVYGDGSRHKYTPDGIGGYSPPIGIHSRLAKNGDGTYTVTRKDQIVYNFDAEGKLVSMVDRNANMLSLIYTAGQLTRIDDTVGRYLEFSYSNINGNDRITAIQLKNSSGTPIKPSIQYEYDANGYGNLWRVTDARGNAVVHEYDPLHDNKHFLKRIVNRRGNTEVENYYGDPDGTENNHGYWVVRQRDALSNETTYVYDCDNRITQIAGPDGEITRHFFDDQFRFTRELDPDGHSVHFVYDAVGNQTQVTDKKGYSTHFTYDANGNVLTKTDPANVVTTMAYNGFNDPTEKVLDATGMAITWTYGYDDEGNLEKEIDPELNETVYTYYDSGQVKTVTDANGNTTEYFYEDTHSNLTRTRGPGGCESRFWYDDAGRKTHESDPLGHETAYHYDANDNLEWIDDTSGNRIVYTYDENNNRVSTQNRRGYTTTYEYDVKDRLHLLIGPEPSGHVTRTEYDAYDRKRMVVDTYGHETEYVYDAMGNLDQLINADDEITQFEYDPNGNKTKMIDPLGNEWEYGYDENNRLVWEEDPLNNRTRYAYYQTGWSQSVTDAKGQQTQFDYYPTGRLKQVTDPEGGQSYFTYDDVGNRLTERDARGNTITYEYDAYNRVNKIIDRNQKETVFEYDCLNMTARIDGNGDRVDFTQYDRYQQLERKEMPGPEVVTFSYDLNGNLQQMTDPLGTTTYTYDEKDRVTSVSDPFGKTVGYTYDSAVHRTTLTYPYLKTVVYDYDSMGRLGEVSDWLGYTTTYSYDNRGFLSSVINTKGTRIHYSYDAAGRLVATNDVTSAGTTIASYDYKLDQVGNRQQVVMDVPLEPVFANKNVTARYDPANQIVNWDDSNFVFDDAGRVAQRTKSAQATQYSFNMDDRLTEVVDGPDTWQYIYNGNGDRLASRFNGIETRYVLDLTGDMSKVLCETDAAGTITAYYVYGEGLLYKITPSGERYHYHYNPVGSTVALTDESEVISDKYAYDPFGELVNCETTTDNPFTFVGKYGVMEEGNGLLFMRARFYDPESKRFLSRDPIKGEEIKTHGMNSFLYVENNPLLAVDPNGTDLQVLDQLIYNNLKKYSEISDSQKDTYPITQSKKGRYLIVEDEISIGSGFGRSYTYVTVYDTQSDVTRLFKKENWQITFGIPINYYAKKYYSNELPIEGSFDPSFNTIWGCFAFESDRDVTKDDFTMGAGLEVNYGFRGETYEINSNSSMMPKQLKENQFNLSPLTCGWKN